MKTAGVLFSGGKDSSLAALLLDREYQVELNTFVFRENTNIESVEYAADVLGMPLIKRVFPDGFLDEVVTTMARDGFPNNAINLVHRNAICSLAGGYDVIGDGTRLNDRVPMLGLDDVQRIEARYKSASCVVCSDIPDHRWTTSPNNTLLSGMERPVRSQTGIMNMRSVQHSEHRESTHRISSRHTTASRWSWAVRRKISQ